jgi:hypothetical protein
LCPKSKLGAAVFLERTLEGDRFCSSKSNKLSFCNCYKTKKDLDDVSRCPQKISNFNWTIQTVDEVSQNTTNFHTTNCTNLFLGIDKDILISILIGLVALLFCFVLFTVAIALRIKLVVGDLSLLGNIFVWPRQRSTDNDECLKPNNGIVEKHHEEKILGDDQYLSIIQSQPNFFY